MTNIVLDALFPSDNEWGIPVLDSNYQAEVAALPFTKWGTIRRSSIMQGTYHFYTDDYKFTGLWTRPAPLVTSRCHNIVEPNFSTTEMMPRVEALHRIYQKRWIARYAQQYGIRVFVDMCVEPAFSDINLLGVPYGWRAYANRGYQDSRFDLLERDYELACERRGGDDILYVVYGGGKKVQALCLNYQWIWIPEQSDTVRGRFTTPNPELEERAEIIRNDTTSTQKELAERFGVSQATISDIKNGKTWKNKTVD